MLVPPTWRSQLAEQVSLVRRWYLIDEFLCLLPSNAADRADFLVIEQNTIILLRTREHLWSERRRDELSGGRELVDHRYEE